jgi:serine/threonine-protein kinase RsbW
MNPQINGDARVRDRQTITLAGLARVRGVAHASARAAGLDPGRAEHFAFAVNEAATNAVKYAGGNGQLTVFQDDHMRLCADVSDHGTGLPERLRASAPSPDATGGRGLWLSRQLCDRVDIRSGSAGTVVRLEMRLDT